MALKDKGNDAQALHTLADAIVKFDWRPARADSRDFWIYHILRREAETKIISDYSGLLKGSRQPIDNSERLTMLASCQFRCEGSQCLHVLNDALREDPDLFENRNVNPGFVAACAACALSLRDGDDSRSDTVAERDRAQNQVLACHWLRDELTMEMRHDRPKGSDARGWILRELGAWKRDPGLMSLRDSAALQSLTPEQRDECATFWRAVDEAIARLRGDDPLPSTVPAEEEN